MASFFSGTRTGTFYFVVIALQLLSLAALFQSITGGDRKPQRIVSSSPNVKVEFGEPHYDRLVIFLVDALRADMVAKRSEMRFVRSLLHHNLMHGYESVAHAPTVTLPRLKALMSGGVPRFIDLVYNLANSEDDNADSYADTLIGRLRRGNKRLVLHGDDTWLKLFPGAFLNRSDGTISSFFTPDFVEVDSNVTRHIDEDFDPKFKHPFAADWDVTILHYLGLDHVGHQLGPNSPRMGEKLQEMDTVFERVYRNIAEQDKLTNGKGTLLVMLSDHGMNNAGNHGGNSQQETSAVALFAPRPSVLKDSWSPEVFTHSLLLSRSYQVDIAPTLGLAMGVGVPHTSAGCVQKGAFHDHQAWLTAKEINLSHMKVMIPDHEALLESLRTKDMCQFLQMHLLSRITNTDTSAAFFVQTFCLVLLLLCFLVQVYYVYVSRGASNKDFDSTGRIWSLSSVAAVSAMVIHVLSLGSSSAIENEHATVFHMLTTLLLVLMFLTVHDRKGSRLKLGLLLVVIRVMRSRVEVINFSRMAGLGDPLFLNQGTAVLPSYPGFGADVLSQLIALATIHLVCLHWMSLNNSVLTGMLLLPLTATWIFHFALALWIWMIPLQAVAFGLLITLKSTGGTSQGGETWIRTTLTTVLLMNSVCLVLSYCYSSTTRADDTHSASVIALYGYAVTMGGVLIEAILKRATASKTVYVSRKNDAMLFCLVCTLGLVSLLQRRTNLPVIAAGTVAIRILQSIHQDIPFLMSIMVYFLLGWAMFFAQGNSHSVSTIDIAGGYVGASSYNRERVALLTALVVYTGPIISCLAVLSSTNSVGDVGRTLWLIQSLRLVVASVITVAMQSHLFIWSVFAPRFAYEVLWTVCLLMVIGLAHVLS